MVRKSGYGFIRRLLGREPYACELRCLNEDCDYRECLFVSKTCLAEPYVEGRRWMRAVNTLPTRCPKCGSKKLKKSEGPQIHY